jgi:hypothetical protein
VVTGGHRCGLEVTGGHRWSQVWSSGHRWSQVWSGGHGWSQVVTVLHLTIISGLVRQGLVLLRKSLLLVDQL